MIIRLEQQKDYDEIYQLVKTAFETALHADGDEQDFVLKLRAGEGYIPEFALVIEDNKKLIGHIMLTKTRITTKGQTETGLCARSEASPPQNFKFEQLLLAPLAILKEYRNKGLGALLVNEALSRAKQAGYKAVFLCGDPAYYGRFGFTSVSNYQISYTMDIPSQFVLACELEKGWLKNIKGSISIV